MSKVIAITGGGDGLGRALARRLARDGDTVILLGRTQAKLDAVIDQIGASHLAIQCDVCDPSSVRAAFAELAKHHAQIDVLINNAGVFEPFTLANADPAKVKQHMETNLAGPVYCSHEALPLLRGDGHIINITSDSISLKMPMMWMYAGTKAALEFISDIWVRELEPEGVRVTVVRCGHMRDETKTAWGWDRDVAKQLVTESAKVGIHIGDRGVSHYNSVADGIRAIIETPRDLHVNMVCLAPRSAGSGRSSL